MPRPTKARAQQAAKPDKITPFLWFDGNAEEAVKFYTSIFRRSRIGRISRYPEGGPGKPGSVMMKMDLTALQRAARGK